MPSRPWGRRRCSRCIAVSSPRAAGDVFVAPDVFRADPAIRQQLCYVAVSRARTGVWLLGGETSPDLRATWQRQFDTTRDSE